MSIFDWSTKEVMIIGGTGSLGRTLVKKLIKDYQPKGIRIYSRTEFLQWEFQQELKLAGVEYNIAWCIGDVRDKERLARAMRRVDIVINAAAMKQVPACEDNPDEAIKTNIIGSMNIINCAIDAGVGRVLHVSTDKAVYPINLYGATKTVAEKLFIHANTYTGGHTTRFSCVRYGNVLGSRGSIVPLFREQAAKNGVITITDDQMTRFWIVLDRVSDFIIESVSMMFGAEIFIPKMPSMLIFDTAGAIVPGCVIHLIGIRKGEKLHECLLTEEESVFATVLNDRFVIEPLKDEKTTERFSYTSGTNDDFMGKDEFLKRFEGYL